MEPFVSITGENLKALTHPLRVRALGLLRMHGPATATMLAEQLGLTSGALSYHLRQLERYGFIAEDTRRGNDRDRWWRAVHRATHLDSLALGAGTQDAAEQLEQGIVDALAHRLTQAHTERRTWPEEWQHALEASDVLLDLTPAEALRLQTEMEEVLNRYKAHDAEAERPAGTWTVSAGYQVVPIPPLDRTTP